MKLLIRHRKLAIILVAVRQGEGEGVPCSAYSFTTMSENVLPPSRVTRSV